ncbi:MAG: FtsQ-type POTRA domain-containing protein [Magnetospirillum sp.]|nr:FtsQ-type POTRA domain-containing protein [Magnetospirillum sp.]
MRRLSDSDIVISPGDRPAAGRATPDRNPGGGRAGRPKAPRGGQPKAKPARRPMRRLEPLLTPLQKAVAAGVGAVAVVVGGAIVWHSGIPLRAVRASRDAMLAASADAGLRVSDITVSGRGRTANEQIIAALGVRKGTPILGVDLAEARDRLESIPAVRAASIERRLPGSLHIVIAERQPMALWQHDGVFVLIDRDGHEIPGAIEGFEDLPLVVGDGAPAAAAALMDMLATEPTLASRVKAAVRVGNRRWNLKLDDAIAGMEARLPEDNPEAAWRRLAALEGDHGLTRRHVTMIDLRLGDRLVLKTAHQQAAAERRKDNGA